MYIDIRPDNTCDIRIEAKKLNKCLKSWHIGYSSENIQWALFNEYQHDKVWKVFKNLWVLVLWTKVALALKGLTCQTLPQYTSRVGHFIIWNLIGCVTRMRTNRKGGYKQPRSALSLFSIQRTRVKRSKAPVAKSQWRHGLFWFWKLMQYTEKPKTFKRKTSSTHVGHWIPSHGRFVWSWRG